jgi:dTDP-4-amino-4,6-dideoxygalactose transaminase
MKVPLIDLQAQYRTIKEPIRQAIDKVLESQRFILDEHVRKLEEELAKFAGRRHAVGCASGTDALLLSLIALGIQKGDEVITSAYSFFSSAGMISWIGATPVFVDIDPGTFNIDVDQVRGKISSKTKAILAVHLFGQCCRIQQLTNTKLPVIEDAAQAIGSSRSGKIAGSFGITGCFSFFPTKNLGGYGDGGMICTDETQLAEALRRLRAHGQAAQQYLYDRVGTNSRLDELQAAILRVKCSYLQDWNERRRKNAAHYFEELRDLPIELPRIEPENQPNFHQFVIRLVERDRLKSFLAEKGVGTAIYYPVPLPLQPCFSYLGHRKGEFPGAEKCSATSLALPVYPELTADQLQYVTSCIRQFFR